VGGLANLNKKPDTLVVVDSRREKTAVREAVRAKIPVVALIDTNSNPEDIKYPIPGNDDAIKSIALIVKTLADALEAGYKDYGEVIKEEKRKEKEAEEKEVKEKEAKEKDEKEKEKKAESKDGKTKEKKKEKKKEKTKKTSKKKPGRPKKEKTKKKTTKKKTAKKKS
jgi:small subunit ribosomal protein S2